MQPSRIVKSAWKRAGKHCSLKEYARTHRMGRLWLLNKRLDGPRGGPLTAQQKAGA